MIKAIVFDLDDTLYSEIEYVKSGFRAIARHFKDETLYKRLWDLFCEDRENVYQRMGFSDDVCSRCIEIYRNHKPDISLDEGILEVLFNLKKKGYKLGIITEGRPDGQWRKIYSLGLDKIMDAIIISDEIGGISCRKPSPKPFEAIREKLGVEFDEMVYIGDNPEKDFFIGSIYPIKTVRVNNDVSIYKDAEYLENVKEDIFINYLSEIELCGVCN